MQPIHFLKEQLIISFFDVSFCFILAKSNKQGEDILREIFGVAKNI